MEGIYLTFAHISRGVEIDRKRGEIPQIEPNPTSLKFLITLRKSRGSSLSCLQIRQWTTSSTPDRSTITTGMKQISMVIFPVLKAENFWGNASIGAAFVNDVCVPIVCP
jgi:hypothetical protein